MKSINPNPTGRPKGGEWERTDTRCQIIKTHVNTSGKILKLEVKKKKRFGTCIEHTSQPVDMVSPKVRYIPSERFRRPAPDTQYEDDDDDNDEDSELSDLDDELFEGSEMRFPPREATHPGGKGGGGKEADGWL
jgi:hypothetical protein